MRLHLLLVALVVIAITLLPFRSTSSPEAPPTPIAIIHVTFPSEPILQNTEFSATIVALNVGTPDITSLVVKANREEFEKHGIQVIGSNEVRGEGIEGKTGRMEGEIRLKSSVVGNVERLDLAFETWYEMEGGEGVKGTVVGSNGMKVVRSAPSGLFKLGGENVLLMLDWGILSMYGVVTMGIGTLLPLFFLFVSVGEQKN